MFCTSSFSFFHFFIFFFFFPVLFFISQEIQAPFAVARAGGPDTFICDEQSKHELFRMIFMDVCNLKIEGEGCVSEDWAEII